MPADDSPLVRATLFVMDPGEERPPDYKWVEAWLARWGDRVRVAHYSTGGWEHSWDVEGPAEAIAEIPPDISASSEWSEGLRPPPRERKDRRHGGR